MRSDFPRLVHQLGMQLHSPLEVDMRGHLKLLFAHELHVQIQHDEHKKRILLGSLLCEVPPGKYRENVLKECLKANFTPHPGILGFCLMKNCLTLHTYLPSETSSEALAGSLEHFVAYAKAWKSSITEGRGAPNLKPFESV